MTVDRRHIETEFPVHGYVEDCITSRPCRNCAGRHRADRRFPRWTKRRSCHQGLDAIQRPGPGAEIPFAGYPAQGLREPFRCPPELHEAPRIRVSSEVAKM
jgi:hypothetical protein